MSEHTPELWEPALIWQGTTDEDLDKFSVEVEFVGIDLMTAQANASLIVAAPKPTEAT